MMDSGYISGGTVGGRWGCALSAVIGIPLFGFATLATTMGDCVPDAPCNHHLFWPAAAIALTIAAIIGVVSRALINRLARKWRDRR